MDKNLKKLGKTTLKKLEKSLEKLGIA